MKKRIIISLIVFAALTASLTGCGGDSAESGGSESAREESKAVTAEPLTSADEDESSPESGMTEPPEEETADEVKQYPNITNRGKIRDGSWCFTADNDGTTEHYLYNFDDKALVKFDLEDGHS